MKMFYLLVATAFLVFSFSNCAGPSAQGSDSYGQHVFVDYGPECVQGRLCEKVTDVDCYDMEFYFSPDPKTVCQRID